MADGPLESLHVVGVRYRGNSFVGPAQRAVNAYASANVFAAAGLPVTYAEPRAASVPQSLPVPRVYGAVCGAIADSVAKGRNAGSGVAMVGGNCGHAIGVLAGLQQAHGAGARIGLVWLDAHGDFNTPKTTLSGSLGGMPVAVAAGLGLGEWREPAGMLSPLPTDRIVMADLRNLDPAEAQLLAATDAVVIGPDQPFGRAAYVDGVSALAAKVDMLYLHIDADILDAAYVPNHVTIEPNGPDMAAVQAAVDTVMATGKVVAFALVSVYFRGESTTDIASGLTLLRSSLAAWRRPGVRTP